MTISEIYRSLQNNNNTLDYSMIKKFLEILAVFVIIFTLFFFTCLGCYLVLVDSTSLAVQMVTVSTEEQSSETYHDSLGQYQLAGEDLGADGSSTVWYRHMDREDRFIMYNKQGNIN